MTNPVITTPNNIPIVNQPNLYLEGMNIAYATTTTLTVSAGQARDSSNTVDIVLTAPVTVNSAVIGINGIDVGSFAASKIYYFFAVSDSSGFNNPGVIFSLSRTAPILPLGYDSARQIGSWASLSGPVFALMYQEGMFNDRTTRYDAPVACTSGGTVTATSLTAVDVVGTVPLVDGSWILLNVAHTPSAAGAAHSAIIAPGATSTSTTFWTLSGQVAANPVNANDVATFVNISTTHLYFQAKVGSSDSCVFTVKGFRESL